MAKKRMKSRKSHPKRGYSRKTIKKSRRSKIIKRSKRSKRQNTRKLNRRRKLRGGALKYPDEVDAQRTDAEIREEARRVAALAQAGTGPDTAAEYSTVVQPSSTEPQDQILDPFFKEAEANIDSLKSLLNETDEWAEEANKNPRPIPGRISDRAQPFKRRLDEIIEEARAALDSKHYSDDLTRSEWRRGDRKVYQLQERVSKTVRPFN